TPGSISIFEKNTKILFSGDTLFAHGYFGRTDLGGSEKDMKKSLEILKKIDWKVLCPGHGELEYKN
ncbi:MAG: MBL fold metallo-hydrolase, partial [Candidatus Anstonellaceae archaeon]